jgi:outer membrane protein assembly factor BamB
MLASRSDAAILETRNMPRFLAVFALSALGCGSGPADSGAAEPARRADQANLSTRKSGDDWPGFLGPLGTSVSTEKGIIAPWPKDGLRLVWKKQLGVGYAAPSVSQGRLYHFDRYRDQNRLTCLTSETGEQLWQFEYPTNYDDMYGYNNGPRCCAVVDGERVFIHGPEGMLHALGARDGKLLWKVDTKADFHFEQNFFGVGSTPVVEGDALIVHVGGMPKGSDQLPFGDRKGNGSAVVAFDKATGKTKYQLGDELASYASPVLATIDKRRWCFVFARGGLLGFDPTDGKVDFHFPWRAKVLESVNASNPVVAGDRVLISETYGPGGAALKVKPGGYEVIWTDKDKGRNKSLQCHWNTPIYHDGYVYGCSGRHDSNAELRCVELATGKVMWSEPKLTRTSLLMVDGHFVCLGEFGQVLLLKVNHEKYDEVSSIGVTKTGETETELAKLLKYPCWAAPVLSHGLLYLRGKDWLVCLELVPEKK